MTPVHMRMVSCLAAHGIRDAYAGTWWVDYAMIDESVQGGFRAMRHNPMVTAGPTSLFPCAVLVSSDAVKLIYKVMWDIKVKSRFSTIVMPEFAEVEHFQ